MPIGETPHLHTRVSCPRSPKSSPSRCDCPCFPPCLEVCFPCPRWAGARLPCRRLSPDRNTRHLRLAHIMVRAGRRMPASLEVGHSGANGNTVPQMGAADNAPSEDGPGLGPPRLLHRSTLPLPLGAKTSASEITPIWQRSCHRRSNASPLCLLTRHSDRPRPRFGRIRPKSRSNSPLIEIPQHISSHSRCGRHRSLQIWSISPRI